MMLQCERQGAGKASQLYNRLTKSDGEKNLRLGRPFEQNKTGTMGNAVRLTGRLGYLEMPTSGRTLDRLTRLLG
ncbi:hypothetical protein MES4922_170025 [Mesorhizobium ventifaucium]|uniref:Uncharacterized protein n=2 Tax=Mesorhizobium ventifaucium TaxID=666020 RepID=A0ABM9DJ10_9HYPH|nr:hypothetical protein MES4922_170025 [Mesorhizobium ventifaucium]